MRAALQDQPWLLGLLSVLAFQSCHRYLDPGVLIIVAGGPGIDNAVVVEAGKLWPPALEAKEAIIDRGC